ncbi:hypothetical protein BLNAU_25147 [Blattamonas nauphoetae]|uniref:Uncharacterized protein n=1 Tax=Blattamonas nauphoetae TaxID=2049346 RepID=A0ABQ9WKU4_9EUKA|nr:hypothetical protein BLNAU_25147 [Blattamonas nauphoetae]
MSPSMVATLSFSFATTRTAQSIPHCPSSSTLGNSEEPKFFFIHANPSLSPCLVHNGSSTDSIPSVKIAHLVSWPDRHQHNDISLKHVTQHCPELYPSHFVN